MVWGHRMEVRIEQASFLWHGLRHCGQGASPMLMLLRTMCPAGRLCLQRDG